MNPGLKGDGWPDAAAPDEIHLRGPADAIALVPYVLGFHPRESLVVLTLGGDHRCCAACVDLPPVEDHMAPAEMAGRLAEFVTARRASAVSLIGYGAEARLAPLLGALHAALDQRGQPVEASVRVAGGRYWKWPGCGDPYCCPPQGRPINLGSGALAAKATFAGRATASSRDGPAHSLDPVEGHARRRMSAVTEAVERDWPPARLTGGEADPLQHAMPLIGRLYRQAAEGGPPPTEHEIAQVGVLLTVLRVRDEALARMDFGNLRAYARLWTQVVRHVELRYLPAPATLLAYCAHMTGDAALADRALRRAQAADPCYPLAAWFARLFVLGIPPSLVRPDRGSDEPERSPAQDERPAVGGDDDDHA
ncbi:DUF4192 domain-containing protein [Actinomadura rupiterrae]|uniref:DUF4192 domain-containing protein n=1 Tax=Actinomadura rupiterrae TaxID=559627 RepID=UPI0020A5F427|nr:DUF4192 domain-containing protein [Actinomadura rupiterrae]MCP2341151.1 hypothetical protein [Actinomadura rupiterrae]